MAGAGGLAASGAHSRARCAPPRASGPLQPPERSHPPPPAALAGRVADPRARQPRRTDETGRTDDNIGSGFPPDRRSATHILDRPLGGRPPITLNPRWLCSQTNRLTRNEPRLGEARRPRPHITDGCYALPIDRRKRPRAAQSRRYCPTPTPTARSERVSPPGTRRASSALRAVRARGSPPPASRAPSPRRRGQVPVSVIGDSPTRRATRPEGAKPTPVLLAGGSTPLRPHMPMSGRCTRLTRPTCRKTDCRHRRSGSRFLWFSRTTSW
jgi:hypothetical protein